MAQVDNISDIKFSTAFVPDKVFPQKFTGSFSVDATSSAGTPKVTTTSLDNPYGADTFPFMLYSLNNSDWYDGGQAIQTGISVTLSAVAYTTASSIVVVATNYTTSAYTLYYKIGLISDD